MPISTLRSTLAWPARVGMRCPQVKHFVESNTAEVNLLTF
jgi:hypothetical protein